MYSHTRFRRTRPLALALAVSMAVAAAVYAPGASAQSYQTAYERAPAPAFTQQELDQMLAPIALYPDSLLSQIMMAATYPLEVVEAARWSRAHPGLRGDDAVRAVADEDWDPSVKSLLAFPQVLDMMDQKLDWTERLGDAFLDQESAVMDSVQWLRQKAYAAGNLRSDAQVRVAEAGETIIVEPANPRVVYVPYYDPLVVYGSWWWPSYPPVYWAPWPGYYARPGVPFVWGSGITISTGFFFGAFDWPHRQARVVHVNNYYYHRSVVRGHETRGARVAAGNTLATPGQWRHDPDHRRGVPYRAASQGQFVRGAAAETPSQTRARNGAGDPTAQTRPAAGAQTRPGAPTGARYEDNPAASVAPRAEERAQAQPGYSRADSRRDDRPGANVERQSSRSAGFERPQHGGAGWERQERGNGGERAYTRAPDSARSEVQTAPARAVVPPQGARVENRVPEAAREAPRAQSGPAPEMRTHAAGIERHPAAADGRSRDADTRASRERGAVEARVVVPAPQPAVQVQPAAQRASPQAAAAQQPEVPPAQPSAQAPAPRQWEPGARSMESRAEARRDARR